MPWAVYLEDTNGARRLVGGGLTLSSENEAHALIEKIVGAHTKPHKVDYYIIEYTHKTRDNILAELHIAM